MLRDFSKVCHFDWCNFF